jgi:hypothetical protein
MNWKVETEVLSNLTGIVGAGIALLGLVTSAISLEPLFAVVALACAILWIIILGVYRRGLRPDAMRAPQLRETASEELATALASTTQFLVGIPHRVQTETSATNIIVSAPPRRESSPAAAPAEAARE